MESLEQQVASGNYVELPHKDAYATYFNQLARVFTVLESWVEARLGSESPEVEVLKNNLHRIHQSTELLRLKYLYEPTHSLRLDLSESGFPHFNELQRMVGDFVNVDEYLRELPPELLAIEQTLDELFETKKQPQEGLQLLGRRHYLERLSKADFLGPFRFGGVRLIDNSRESHRVYVASWACYSSRDNYPYLHFLQFEQGRKEEALERGTQAYMELKQFVEKQSSHIPPLAVLATAIDEEFDSLHPKMLRRVALGPIILPIFSFDEGPLAQLLRKEAKPSDFVLQMESEIIVSDRQVVREKGGLFRDDKVREIFAIDHREMECFDRKLSEIRRFIFMPHRVWQAVENTPDAIPEKFKQGDRLAFDEQNNVHSL